ncbi:unnamed protein product [Cylicocyclus nassatus]|uniref:Glucosamine 6-phosphate N-acetyltransferase n=1 Tax=Cylicocyclus nassatus TaxID=53992 RepID=A0AA36MEV4_CYLNA|nr:unnamed protein product [Cylicocyclus nassatus]
MILHCSRVPVQLRNRRVDIEPAAVLPMLGLPSVHLSFILFPTEKVKMPMLQPRISIPLNREVGINEDYSDYMFNPDLLTPEVVGEVLNGFHVRPLKITDYDNGFLEVLAQLTTVGDVSREAFEDRFRSMSSTRPLAYYVVVVENVSSGKVVAAATLVIEWKFIHEAGCRGRVEDVVVDKEMRGKKMGALLNRILVALAKQIGVYKLSLECKDSLIPFYELYGYQKDVGNNFLVQRFDNEVQIPCDDGEIRIPSNIGTRSGYSISYRRIISRFPVITCQILKPKQFLGPVNRNPLRILNATGLTLESIAFLWTQCLTKIIPRNFQVPLSHSSL